MVLAWVLPFNLSAQDIKSEWQSLLNQPGLADYFDGLFENLGITVNEIDQHITVQHKGDHFELMDGILESVDYHINLDLNNISNMKSHGRDGTINEYESYRIMAVLFTPMTESALKHDMFNKTFKQKLAGIENHIHVYLNSPTNDEFQAHTLIFINKKWIVIPGLHGDAKRVFDLSPDQAIDYQKQVYMADKVDTRKAWRNFNKWYLKWRKKVSK